MLRQIVENGAKANGQKVCEALLAFQTAIYAPSFKNGQIIVNTSGNGQAASYQIAYAGASYTKEAVFQTSEEFFGIYEHAMQQPGLVDDGQSLSSENIFQTMLGVSDRLQTVTRRGADFTLLGWPLTGQLSGV